MHIDELCDLCGLSRWGIHYYRRLGAISPPRGVGRWATWSDTHVRQIRQIRETAVDGRVTIADMAENPAKYFGKR